jgi:hypothetical protein
MFSYSFCSEIFILIFYILICRIYGKNFMYNEHMLTELKLKKMIQIKYTT